MSHPWFLSVIPYSSNFLRRMEWSTVSKAFDRSMNTPSVYLLFSKDSIIWSTNCITAWSFEWPFWKLNCLDYKILFSIKSLYKGLYIMRSSILGKQDSWFLFVLLLLGKNYHKIKYMFQKNVYMLHWDLCIFKFLPSQFHEVLV